MPKSHERLGVAANSVLARPQGAGAGNSSSAEARLFAEWSGRPQDERILPERVDLYLAEVEREQYLRIVYNDDPNAPETWMFTRLTEQEKIYQTRGPLEWTQDQLVHVEYVRPDLPDSGVNLRRLMAALDATATAAARWFNQWYATALAGAARSFEWFSSAVAGMAWQTETVVDPLTGQVTRHYFNPLTGQFHFAATPNVGECAEDPTSIDDDGSHPGDGAWNARDVAAILEIMDEDLARFWRQYGDIRQAEQPGVFWRLTYLWNYQTATVVEAEQALEEFAQGWDAKYPTIAKTWRARWADIITLFDFPPPMRRAIYTTNAIESVHSVIRKFTRNRKIYPNEESALKIVYMAVHEASKRWTMPIRHWKQALNHFAILYEGRMPEQASK